jgi:hypothetical protein
MGRVLGLAGLLLLSSLAVAEAAIQVQVDGDRLTLRAENAPLQDILKTLADAGQFSLRLDAPLTDPISVQFEQRPLLDVLDALLGEQSMLIRYTREQGRLRVEEVQVLAPSPPSGDSQAVALGTPVNPSIPVAVTGPSIPAAVTGEMPASEAGPQEQGPTAGDRIAEALALAEIGQPETGRQVLIDLVRTHEEPEVRQEALAVLTGLEAAPLEPFASAALEDKDVSVRLLALALVGERAQTEPAAQGVLRYIAERGAVLQVREDDVDLRLIAGALLEDLRDRNP